MRGFVFLIALCATGCMGLIDSARHHASTRTGCPLDEVDDTPRPIRYQELGPKTNGLVFRGCEQILFVRCQDHSADDYGCRLVEVVDVNDPKLTEPFAERTIVIAP